jgi:hypothetical protein
MSLPSNTLSWLRADQSFLLLLYNCVLSGEIWGQDVTGRFTVLNITRLIANFWQLFLHSYGQLVPNNNTNAQIWLLTNIENKYIFTYLSKRQWTSNDWTYWDICQYYILYCSIATIWVHFKWNYNLFYQVLINVITVVLFSLYLNWS